MARSREALGRENLSHPSDAGADARRVALEVIG